MKNLKKDNKGFSLVELIVVVLIMAIIAVALAPQVIKWVNNSRISSDNNTKEAIISAVQTCLTDEKVFKEITNGTAASVSVNNTEATVSAGSGFKTKFEQYASVSLDGSGKTKAFKTKQDGCTITVSVGTDGKLTASMSGGVTDISDK